MMAGQSDASSSASAAPPSSSTLEQQPQQQQQRGERLSTQCSLCAHPVPYDYTGKTPPFAPRVVFLEDVFAIRDPFAVAAQTASLAAASLPKRCLAMGARCAECNRIVCMQATCSLFYQKRFCALCAKQWANCFPSQLKPDLERLREGHGSSSSTSTRSQAAE
ncbi:hypothetical protein CAOG_07099 [Capsaspora owczarzaki ATCC 30864]|uniref:Cysteine-rich DPF motif domain-containing protein 1 n=1 Tax=Capsaspora owczarzaki (strain ATCC 30864) TaxID=595528 RepID=A0A0D2VYM5_CAPO3|nr:hypothetical protein CAOG_07099 [Capsaspora owczarzaki ATCC 30864]KJE96837.1 hypothetical protein CAOG_007099 [Capsaspora owczarzaki ATCC 30864]|eukprot:XP_004343823.2 hypothetical protein CAOG_07099 [Capsaspora owczarzaki ATCC 30864]